MEAQKERSGLVRSLILLYGILCYFIGVAGLAALVLALAGLLPYGFLSLVSLGDGILPIIWNILLVALWGLVHSVMARDSFKEKLVKLLPEPAERSTYVVVAGVTSVLLVGLWQPVGGFIWSVTNEIGATVLWVGFVFGWVYLLAATFAINHFDLFGLRQVYLGFKNQPRPSLAFTKRAMYRFTRHPIQTGVLIGIWSNPQMTINNLILCIGFTAYIFIGLRYEERDLVADIGEDYEAYRKETGGVFPKIF